MKSSFSKSKPLWCLHGFLGQSSDWNFFYSDLNPRIDKNIKLFFPSLYPKLKLFHEGFSMQEWAKGFCHQVRNRSLDNFIMGYSMGGRLAFHLLMEDPSLWKKAIIISSNPGLRTKKQVLQRNQSDKKWAENFLSTHWNTLMQQWSQQVVFRKSHFSPKRLEKDYSREVLAKILVEWSVAKQKNFRNFLSKIKVPVLWMSGEYDENYVKIGEEVSQLSPYIEHFIVPHSSHRVPWDNSKVFLEKVNSFICS